MPDPDFQQMINKLAHKLTESDDVMRAMAETVRQHGWDIEWSWKDTQDGTADYEVYLWRNEGEPDA